jgi:hypothetical protein
MQTHTHTHVYIYTHTYRLIRGERELAKRLDFYCHVASWRWGIARELKSKQQSRRPFYYRTRCVSLSAAARYIRSKCATKSDPGRPKRVKGIDNDWRRQKKRATRQPVSRLFAFSNHFEIFETNKSERIFLIVFKLDRDSCSRPNFIYIIFFNKNNEIERDDIRNLSWIDPRKNKITKSILFFVFKFRATFDLFFPPWASQ